MSEVTFEMNKKVNQKFSQLATDASIEKTMEALGKNGIESHVFESTEALKKKFFELLPYKEEVMTMTSQTIDKLGITDEINNSGKYDSIRNKMRSLDYKTQRKIGSDANYSVGSVHAITENGTILIASATGSQLSAYAYASAKIIWVVGTQKIVKNNEEGIQRINEYSFPLEDERAKIVYKSNSKIGKILMINSETPGRMTVLFLKQNIGF